MAHRRKTSHVLYGFVLLVGAGAALLSHAQEQQKTPAPPGAPSPNAKPAIAAPALYRPTEVDLKAAYCRPVVAASTAEHLKALKANLPPNLQQAAKERHAAAIERTRRLEFYLLPRLNTLQSSGLLEAQARAYTDLAGLAEVARNCDTKCSGIADTAAATACRVRCSEGSDAAKRARECDDISWLPLKDY